ncbi:glycosyltransferase family 2 protein [Methylotenera sp. 1P/1]|uniref:glycosyltransferase family 2 protein n=1 Tax=Methylotenera sp. 1P/1 TaxID=1131551 RepID=UPI00036CCC88|nr:glycosyltransferase family 2 protein [Methylotenera sp. 1P/1]
MNNHLSAEYSSADKVVSVCIVVLNWNGWKDTIECLQSLSELAGENYSVVVVDNASTDGSREKLLAWASGAESHLRFTAVVEEVDIDHWCVPLRDTEWVYVQSSVNGGFAAGNNLGIRLAMQAGCQYVWLLNNDTVVASQALVALEQYVAKNPDIGMCGSILCYYNDRAVVQAVGGVRFNYWLARGEQLGHGLLLDDARVRNLVQQAPTYVAGASLFMPVGFLQDIGLMEESYFLYFEEMDWAVRAAGKWKIATAVDSIVYHKEGASIGTASRGKRSVLSQYYLNRNLIRFYALRKRWLLPVAVIRVMRDVIKHTVYRDFKLLNATTKALTDGILMRGGPKGL